MAQGKKVIWTDAAIKEVKELYKTMTIHQLTEKYHTSTSVIRKFVGKKKENMLRQLPIEKISSKAPLYERCQCLCIPCVDNQICPLSEVKHIG